MEPPLWTTSNISFLGIYMGSVLVAFGSFLIFLVCVADFVNDRPDSDFFVTHYKAPLVGILAVGFMVFMHTSMGWTTSVVWFYLLGASAATIAGLYLFMACWISVKRRR